MITVINCSAPIGANLRHNNGSPVRNGGNHLRNRAGRGPQIERSPAGNHNGIDAADIAASASLMICSVLSLPVSTTHAKTTAIMGVGAVKSIKAINLGVVKEMVLTWILTFPGCGLIGFLMTKLFMWLF